jgi:hypothetical protein
MYERPEKRARLTLLDGNDARVGVYGGVSSSFFVVFYRPYSDYIFSKESGGQCNNLQSFN